MAEVRLLSDQLGSSYSGFVIGYGSSNLDPQNIIVGTYNEVNGSGHGSVVLGREVHLGCSGIGGCGHGVAIGDHLHSAFDGQCVMIGSSNYDFSGEESCNVLIGNSVGVYGKDNICIGSSIHAINRGNVLIGNGLPLGESDERCIKIGDYPINTHGSSRGAYVCMGSTYMSFVCSQDGLEVVGYYTEGDSYNFFIPWSQLQKVNDL